MPLVTIYTSEIEKIFDALVFNEYTGGTISIEVNHPNVFLRDKEGKIISSWTREEYKDD
ncbi:MAG: hypothetical protein ACTHMV_13485 [Chitinophagaceae bacterium]